jgi:hypothetical protein
MRQPGWETVHRSWPSGPAAEPPTSRLRAFSWRAEKRTVDSERHGTWIREAEMRLRSRQRHLVIFSSSTHPARQYAASLQIHAPLTGRIRRWFRVGALVTVIVVRPRWKPLLAGMALTIFGFIEHSSMASISVLPGIMLLWAAVLIPGDSDIDHQRRQQLMRELAVYSTPAQRRDLEACLDQYPDGVTGEIRAILASQGAPAHRTGVPGAGRY